MNYYIISESELDEFREDSYALNEFGSTAVDILINIIKGRPIECEYESGVFKRVPHTKYGVIE